MTSKQSNYNPIAAPPRPFPADGEDRSPAMGFLQVYDLNTTEACEDIGNNRLFFCSRSFTKRDILAELDAIRKHVLWMFERAARARAAMDANAPPPSTWAGVCRALGIPDRLEVPAWAFEDDGRTDNFGNSMAPLRAVELPAKEANKKEVYKGQGR